MKAGRAASAAAAVLAVLSCAAGCALLGVSRPAAPAPASTPAATADSLAAVEKTWLAAQATAYANEDLDRALVQAVREAEASLLQRATARGDAVVDVDARLDAYRGLERLVAFVAEKGLSRFSAPGGDAFTIRLRDTRAAYETAVRAAGDAHLALARDALAAGTRAGGREAYRQLGVVEAVVYEGLPVPYGDWSALRSQADALAFVDVKVVAPSTWAVSRDGFLATVDGLVVAGATGAGLPWTRASSASADGSWLAWASTQVGYRETPPGGPLPTVAGPEALFEFGDAVGADIVVYVAAGPVERKPVTRRAWKETRTRSDTVGGTALSYQVALTIENYEAPSSLKLDYYLVDMAQRRVVDARAAWPRLGFARYYRGSFAAATDDDISPGYLAVIPPGSLQWLYMDVSSPWDGSYATNGQAWSTTHGEPEVRAADAAAFEADYRAWLSDCHDLAELRLLRSFATAVVDEIARLSRE